MKAFLRRSFRNRLTAAFLVAALVPLLICSASLLETSRLRMNSRTEADAQLQAQNMGLALDKMTTGLSQAAEALRGNEQITQALSGGRASDVKVYDALFTATAGMRGWAEFELYDLVGQRRYTTRGTFLPGSLPTDWGLLHAAGESTGTPVYVTGEEDGEAGAPLLRGAVQLPGDGGGPAGYLVMGMKEADFSVLFDGTYGAQNDILLLDRFWHPVYASQSALIDVLAPVLRQQLLDGVTPGAGAEEFQYSVARHGPSGLYLVLQQPQMFTKSTMGLLYTVSLGCALACVLLSVGMSLTLSRQVFSPVQKLQQAISQVSRDNLDVQIPVDSEDELGLLAKDFNRMVAALKRNREELVESERELNRAQIRMLQAQLNPHFLCNTLDTMKWTAKIHNLPQVALMSTNLADILRFCISPEEFVPLYRETETLERYIEIQRLRLGEGFVFRVDLPEELEECLVPKMILQPLVENAILHGLGDGSGNEIRVDIRRGDQELAISVTDNGRGLPEDMVGRPYTPDLFPEGNHLGLYNVHTILTKYYGQTCGLYLDRGDGGIGACIRFTMPIRKEEGKC